MGSAAAFYLTAAGIGRITISDDSTVSLPDLQSQILHSIRDLNLAKTQSAREKLEELNPDVKLDVLPAPITLESAAHLRQHDVLLDTTQDTASHYALNEACVSSSLPLLIADVDGFRARIHTVVPGEGPCYRCIQPDPPEMPGRALLGPLAGVVGSLLVIETVKLLLNKGHPLLDRVLDMDLLTMKFSSLPVSRDPDCPVCQTASPACRPA